MKITLKMIKSSYHPIKFVKLFKSAFPNKRSVDHTELLEKFKDSEIKVEQEFITWLFFSYDLDMGICYNNDDNAFSKIL